MRADWPAPARVRATHQEKGYEMPGRGAPTFLKRQKEQNRTARAIAKRAARQARRDSRAKRVKSDQALDEEGSAEPKGQDPGPDSNPTD